MKRPAVVPLAATATALLGIAIACGSKTVTVATFECEVPDGGDGGTSARTCPAGQFCLTSGCGVKLGLCQRIVPDECETFAPECGCDGITYYNACVRQTAGAGFSSTGPCDDPAKAKMCSEASECGNPNAFCATIIPNLTLPTMFPQAGFDLLEAGIDLRDGGVGLPDGGFLLPGGAITFCRQFAEMCCRRRFCWVLPEQPPSTSTPGVAGCDQLSTFPPGCIDELSAIRNGGVYFACSPADAAAP